MYAYRRRYSANGHPSDEGDPFRYELTRCNRGSAHYESKGAKIALKINQIDAKTEMMGFTTRGISKRVAFGTLSGDKRGVGGSNPLTEVLHS